jgi:hypothetical protein
VRRNLALAVGMTQQQQGGKQRAITKSSTKGETL